jgi:hypothetical protein
MYRHTAAPESVNGRFFVCRHRLGPLIKKHPRKSSGHQWRDRVPRLILDEHAAELDHHALIQIFLETDECVTNFRDAPKLARRIFDSLVSQFE